MTTEPAKVEEAGISPASRLRLLQEKRAEAEASIFAQITNSGMSRKERRRIKSQVKKAVKGIK